MAGPWEDYAPAARAAGPWDDYSASSKKGTVEKLTDPLRYGASKAAEGYQSTLHETGSDGVISNAMGSAARASAPADYTPAHVTLNPRTWGDIPKALGEAAPGMAPDIAAGAMGASAGAAVGSAVPVVGTAIGGLLGGALGAGVSYGARNYGNDARSAAVANGGNDTSELTASDKARALLMSGVGGLASRLGFKGAMGAPVKAAGAPMGEQLLGQLGKGAAFDAGTNVAQEAAHQGLITQQLDPGALGGAAVTGAATGAGLRSLGAVKDLNAASKFKDLKPEEALPVAQKLQAVHGEDYRGTAAQDYQAVTKVADDLGVRAKSLAGDENVTKHLKALKEVNQSDTTGETLARVQQDIAQARKPSADDLASLKDSIGQFPHGADLIDTLQQQATLNKIKSLGNYDTKGESFSGGMSSTPFVQHVISPLGKIGGMADVGAAAYTLTGHTLPGMSFMHALGGNPAAALALPAAQGAIYGGLRVGDAFTGNRSPTSMFLNRFGDGTTGSEPAAPRGPSFMDSLNAAKEAEQVSRTQDKAVASLEGQRSRALQSQVITEAKQRASASKALEAQRSRELQKQVVSQDAELSSAAKSLEAQRSRELQRQVVSKDAELVAASRALEAQKSRALEKQVVSEDARLSSASKSLEAQRSRELQKQVVSKEAELAAAARSLEQQKARAMEKQVIAEDKAPALAEKIAAAKLDARLRNIGYTNSLMKNSERLEKSANKASANSRQPKTAAGGEDIVTAPHMTRFATPDSRSGFVSIPTENIRGNKAAWVGGVAEKLDARRGVVESAMNLPMSPAGKMAVAVHHMDIIHAATDAKSSAEAFKAIEKLTEGMSNTDRANLMHHLANARDPQTGRTFASTWGN